MDYEVQTVGDDELPEGRHVVIVERESGPPLMILNGTPARIWALMLSYGNACEDVGPPAVLRLAI